MSASSSSFKPNADSTAHSANVENGQTIFDKDVDVLEPEPVRKGGLMRKDTQHTFKQPAKRLEPPTPRTSVLGLDRLAKEKRATAAIENSDSRKKPRYDDSNEPVFKSVMGNIRQRGEETPSHPGGLSEVARKRLEEHRKERQRAEGIAAEKAPVSEQPRGLGDFQRRSNRDRGWAGRGRHNDRNNDRNNDQGRGWEGTPRQPSRDDAPSVRVPNVGWDSTPRTQRGGDRDPDGGWGRAKNRGWDAPTPRASRDDSPGYDVSGREWEEEQVKLDRDWYTGGEGGAADEDYNPLAQYEDLNLPKQAEIAAKQAQKKISARQAQYNADNDLWETNRMLTSGIAQRRSLDLDFEDESESTVHVMVHDKKPPFLDGRTVYTKQLEPINPIRDPTSDIAIFAKKGSPLVREKREQAERAKAAAKLASVAGTALGNIMGVRDEEADADAEAGMCISCGCFIGVVVLLAFTQDHALFACRGEEGRREGFQERLQVCDAYYCRCVD
ncbi:hypothetical protein BOTBODRAFT_105454 [Botryobasidium botryosum FD-172 SS1]|uniref:Uncharacterized protein n=1 Tax=Botryobasidium botryosum (strain FD-172 SS1) TaxID=930990 RepID=A0A067MPR7_BOTB1|nr:hypothetical protein BOTBODRAFT_105454 [Botryobasidium botryosum FD-172 SS1]